MNNRQKKEALVEELSRNIEGSKTLLLCNYKGISVKEISDLRRRLRSEKASLKVIKKTLASLAFEKAGIDGVKVKEMEGQVAVVFGGKDEVSSAKTLAKFAKENDKLKILGGTLERKFISAEKVRELAKLPSKEEMLGILVGTIQAPVTSFVRVLSGNLRGLVLALNAIKEKKS